MEKFKKEIEEKIEYLKKLPIKSNNKNVTKAMIDNTIYSSNRKEARQDLINFLVDIFIIECSKVDNIDGERIREIDEFIFPYVEEHIKDFFILSPRVFERLCELEYLAKSKSEFKAMAIFHKYRQYVKVR